MIDCFSETYGRVKLLAKFAQGKSKRFSGKLETTYYLRGIVYKGKSFYILTDCDIINPFLAIRVLIIVYCVRFICWISSHFQHNKIQQNKPLFKLLFNALNALDIARSIFRNSSSISIKCS